mgnify:CR=1 FL=1
MPKFDEKIRDALKKASIRDGSQAALCKKTGISTSIMSRYLKGNVTSINTATWTLLHPVIREFLPSGYLDPRIVDTSESTWDAPLGSGDDVDNEFLKRGQVQNRFFGEFEQDGYHMRIEFSQDKMPDWNARRDWAALLQQLGEKIDQWFEDANKKTEERTEK